MTKIIPCLKTAAFTARAPTAARVSAALISVLCLLYVDAAAQEHPLSWLKSANYSASAGEPLSDDALMSHVLSAWTLHRKADTDRALAQLAQRQVDDPLVLSQMGWIYIQENRMEDAFKVIQKAAFLNDPWAEASYGRTLYRGCSDINLPADRAAGLVWMRRSANQGFPAAKAFLRAYAFRNVFGSAAVAIGLIYLFLLRNFARHLQRYHQNIWQTLDKPLLFAGMSMRSAKALQDFIAERNYARLGDRRLTIRGDVLLALSFTFLGGFAALLLAGLQIDY